MSDDRPGPAAASVVVAFQDPRSGRLFVGKRWEQHADLRVRCDLGERTEGWLTAGFVDLETKEFLDRGQAFERFPKEAGRARGHGVADSSDFACIRAARLRRIRRERKGRIR